ncbi:hypothetical protein ABDC58_21375 [Klebsiella pneumoniae]|uniref:hypothetical protein n=1 Tax=Klebsiella pneumoniae TaxID=573 RepID=UPI00321A2881
MRHGLAAGWNTRFGVGRTHIQDTPKPAGSPLSVQATWRLSLRQVACTESDGSSNQGK